MSNVVSDLVSPYLTYLKIGAAVAVLTAGGLAYWHYRSVVSDLDTAKAANVALTVKLAAAVDLANANAAQALQADKDRQAAVAALEAAQTSLSANTQTARETEASIRSAPAADDGPVAAVLETLRKNRFSGRTAK